MKSLHKSLDLDANEVRVVWAAQIMICGGESEADDGVIEESCRYFHIDRKGEAQLWLDEEAAALARKYGIPT